MARRRGGVRHRAARRPAYPRPRSRARAPRSARRTRGLDASLTRAAWTRPWGGLASQSPLVEEAAHLERRAIARPRRLEPRPDRPRPLDQRLDRRKLALGEGA